MQYTRYVKPSDISSLTVDQHEIPDPGLLQGVCGLDEHISPEYSATYRSQNQTRIWKIFNDLGDDEKRKHLQLYQKQEGKQDSPGATFCR